MNSYLAVKARPSYALLWALGLMFWVASVGPVQGKDTRTAPTVPNVLLAEGCPYPPQKPAAQGSADSEAEVPDMLFEVFIAPPSPVKPAVFYEDYVEDKNPKIRI